MEILRLTDKPVSLDGPPEIVWGLGENAIPKVIRMERFPHGRAVNHTAIFMKEQMMSGSYTPRDIISVFAGRIMDTGRSAGPTIHHAKKTGAQVLWASTRSIYDMTLAEEMGCDIITMTPALIDKAIIWRGMPVERAMELTIEQFEQDRIPWS